MAWDCFCLTTWRSLGPTSCSRTFAHDLSREAMMPAEKQSQDAQDLGDYRIWTDVLFSNATWVMADLTGTSPSRRILRDDHTTSIPPPARGLRGPQADDEEGRRRYGIESARRASMCDANEGGGIHGVGSTAASGRRRTGSIGDRKLRELPNAERPRGGVAEQRAR